MTIRLNKHIAETGFCSRREADRLIAERRVTVNGQPAGVGAVVGEGDEVAVDGQPLKARAAKAEAKLADPKIAANAPPNVVEEFRRRAADATQRIHRIAELRQALG